MTDYMKAFKQAQYQSVADRVAKYYTETDKSINIPLINAGIPDAYEYRYTNFLDGDASYGGLEWSAKGKKASMVHSYTDIDLFTQQMNLSFSKNDITKFGSQLIADKRDALIAKWAQDVDDACFHGPKSASGTQIAEGLIGQLTSLQNQSSGADADCSGKGEIWLWIQEMLDDIPFAMREEGPDMLLFINEKTYSEARKPDRIYQDKIEWDFIHETFIGPKAVHGRKIGKVIITNKINAEAADNTDGDNADTVDTLGTHGRMLLLVPDPRWVGRIVSRGFSLVGEESGVLGTDQVWGWKGRSYFFNADCANYTEALTF